MHSRRLALIACLTVALAGCAPDAPEARPTDGVATPVPADDDPAETVTVTDGTVRYLDVETGCWVIEDADGTHYEPLVLEAPYKVEGLRVRATLAPRPEMASVCQTGQIVRIVDIEPLEDR